jgi:hypothetical protein
MASLFEQVDVLSCLHSPYLLALIGYCADHDHRLLVYEFMPNGSLQEHLYSDGEKPPFSTGAFIIDSMKRFFIF